MIVVREHFVAKPGQASKLAAMMKDAMSSTKGVRIYTDLTGEFNRVIMETELGSLAEFENRMKDYAANQDLKKKMAGYTDLWVSGGRELLRVM